MTRLINRPVRVRLAADGRLLGFYQGGYQPVSEVLEVWREAGEWWEDAGERTVYRVLTAAGGLFELEFRHSEGCWFLYKAYD